jgi:acyl-CoA thioesterase-1
LIPFLLDGVAGIEKLNQADGIHPTEEGHKIVARNVMKAIQGLL